MSLRPPYSATGRGGTPAPVWEKAFIVMRFARNLAVLANYRTQPRQIPTSNYAPVARRCNRRGLAKPDQGGKQETNGGKLAFIRAVQAFTCHGGGAAVPPSSFISLTFTSQRSLLWYFLGLQESTVPLRPFPVFPAYAISSISYSRVPMPSFSPCSRPACQLVSGNSAVK